MKRTLYLIALICLSIACSDDDGASPELIGTWRMTETLDDPGDGSAIFMPAQFEKTITFLPSGEVESNRTLCTTSLNAAFSGGFYSLQDSIIIPNCPDVETTTNIRFWIEGSNLILTYMCIEACAEKYVKQ